MVIVIQITCPHCSQTFDESLSAHDELAELPCQLCSKTIHKQPADHCVVCSYGSSVCPNLQCRRDCCSG